MGRKGRGKYRKYLKGQVNNTLTLGTLGSKVVVGTLVGDTLVEKAWLSSVKATWTMGEFTEATNKGPIMVGVCHEDYTDAEIEAWIENLASWDQGDKVGQEISRRKIRRIGVFESPETAASSIEVLNDGKPITTKCGWQLTTGQTLKIWAYNMGSAALATTSPNIRTQGHCNLWPN